MTGLDWLGLVPLGALWRTILAPGAVLCIAACAARAVRRHPALRAEIWRFACVGALASTLLSPASIEAHLPGVTVSFGVPTRLVVPPESPEGNRKSIVVVESPGRAAHAVVILWLAGALAVASRLLNRRRASARLIGSFPLLPPTVAATLLRGLPPELRPRGRVELRAAPAGSLPCTDGGRPARILLPLDLLARPATASIVLAHEAAHLRRRDGIVQLAADALAAIAWFNPLVWHARSRNRRLRELAVDRAVLRAGISPGQYGSILLELAARPVLPGAGAMGAADARIADRVREIARFRDAPTTRPHLPFAPLVATVATGVALIAGSLTPVVVEASDTDRYTGDAVEVRLVPIPWPDDCNEQGGR